MASFGELVLVVGDHHLGTRAAEIPEKFRRMLVPNKMQHVVCTGNVGSKEHYDELRQLAPNVHIVSGDCDLTAPGQSIFPQFRILKVGDFK